MAIHFTPAVNPPIRGVTGQTGQQGQQGTDTKLSKGGASSQSPFDFNQMMGLMMMNMMNQGGQGGAGAPMAPAGGAAPALNPNLGALLQHFGSGATRRTMSGQIEGTPAPDPFRNLNAQRDSQQAHDLSRMRHSIAMKDLRAQGGQLPLAPFTPNADQVRADLNSRIGLGQAPAPEVEQFGPYGPAPEGPNWFMDTPGGDNPFVTDNLRKNPEFDAASYAVQRGVQEQLAQQPMGPGQGTLQQDGSYETERTPFRPLGGFFARLAGGK